MLNIAKIVKVLVKLPKRNLTIITPTELPKFVPHFRHVPEVYLNNKNAENAENPKNSENAEKSKDPRTKIILHPDIFSVEHPDIRLLQEAVTWQETYKLVDMTHRISRYENFGSVEQPWPRNTGRTRRKDEKSRQSVLGSSKNAFSGPWSMWSEFSEEKQCQALVAALTVRYAQGDLVIFDGKSIAHRPPEFFYGRVSKKLIKDYQQPYILNIVGDIIVPLEFISDNVYCNSLPVTGLNVLSVLKHDKLHIHVSAIGKIQERLLSWGRRFDIGDYEDFEESHRLNFYPDSKHVEARANWNNENTLLDQVEADGKSYKYKDQHDFGKFYDQSEAHREDIIGGD